MNKNGIKIAFIYVGTVIGAGFASGREIIEFFAIYGRRGIVGIYISGLLFSVLGSMLLLKIYKKEIGSLNQLLESIFYKDIRWIIDTIILLSLYSGFTIMVSASGAIFKEQLGKSFNLGIIVMIVSCFIVFLFDLEGLSFINSILVPLLIVGILFTVFYTGGQAGFNLSQMEGIKFGIKGNYITSAILYFGSNSLIIIVVFSSLLEMISNKRTAIIGGALGGGLLYILSLSILYSILLFYNDIINTDIPMLKISNLISKDYGKLYSIILWSAMFTTALANGFGFINRLGDKNRKLLISVILSISAIPLASLGFSNLVAILYPIFGVIGFVMMVMVLIS